MSTPNLKNPFTAVLSGVSDVFNPVQYEKIDPLPWDYSLKGKNYLVTGANSGIGFAVSVSLAKRGANVWMLCRREIPEAGEKVKQLSGSNTVKMLYVDLTDFDTVEKLCQQLVAENIKIDGLVSNAGAVPHKPSKTKHGLDEMFQVNFVAPFFLAHRLVENNLFNLNGERAPRIVFVSSESHRSGKSIDINDLGNFGNYNLAQAVGWYGHSKILLNTFGTELAEKLKPKIEVHIMCPGPVNTNIIRKAPFVARAFMRVIFTLFFRSASKAAEPIVYLVASPEINGLTCQYLHFLSKKRMDERVYEPNIRKDLWKATEELLQKIGFPVKSL